MWGLVIGSSVIALGTALLVIYTIWGAASMRYEVTPAAVTIHFGPSHIEIARSEIDQIQIRPALSRARRHFGTAFPGLYQGRWSFAETGPVDLYATTLKELVVIETNTQRFGISPDDPRAFQEAVQSGTRVQFSPVKSDAVWALGALGIFFLGTTLIAAVLVLQVGVPRRMEYELGPDALVIHGGLRPILVPYAKITDVKVESPAGRPWKLLGTSVPGLYWGSFSWKQAGPNLKLYATRLRPLVLILSGKNTYGLSPEDPETFLAELTKRLPPQG